MQTYWRVFPWDAGAEPGHRFSPSFIPRPTGLGRFDLPVDLSSVLYLAESPAHAVGEALQSWRNSSLTRRHLELDGTQLALVEVTISHEGAAALIDLCKPRALDAGPTRPDLVASRHRGVTQPIARQAWKAGHTGLRWWSSFWGDWHTTVLFSARVKEDLRFSQPTPLELDSPALKDAARTLGMTLAA